MTEQNITAIAVRPQPATPSLAMIASTPGALEVVSTTGDWFFKSGMFGCKTPTQGNVLALEVYMTGQRPSEIMAENMIVEGRLTKRYEQMLVQLRQSGGDYEWIDDGSDLQKATIAITWKSKTKQYSYTMEMAKRAELVKAGSGWMKRPDNMLRSKAARNGLQMYAPEILNGAITPEDAEEIASEERGSSKPSPEAIAKRRQELESLNSEASVLTPAVSAPPTVTTEAVIEAEVVPVANAAEPPPFEATAVVTAEPAPPARVTQEQLAELSGLLPQGGLTGPMLVDRLKASLKVDHPAKLTSEQAAGLIANFEKAIAAKKAQAAQ